MKKEKKSISQKLWVYEYWSKNPGPHPKKEVRCSSVFPFFSPSLFQNCRVCDPTFFFGKGGVGGARLIKPSTPLLCSSSFRDDVDTIPFSFSFRSCIIIIGFSHERPFSNHWLSRLRSLCFPEYLPDRNNNTRERHVFVCRENAAACEQINEHSIVSSQSFGG